MNIRLVTMSGAPCLLLILILAVFSVGCTSSTDTTEPSPAIIVDYPEDLAYSPEEFWADGALEKAFTRYWRVRFSPNPGDAFALEAPYTPHMVFENRYMTYVNGLSKSKLDGIELRERIFETEYFCAIHFNLHIIDAKGEKKKVFYKDHWVKVNGEWSHVLRDRILFPEAL